MTESLQKLLAEQKEKQRIENELVIAHEVQEQLFPKRVEQLESLEVYGLCRPARTVSGDYFDFLPLGQERLALAVGDISGKGISAALLMATLHSAVRSFLVLYSPEAQAVVPEYAAVGAGSGSSRQVSIAGDGAEISPAQWLAMLNRHLYHATPPEKYATLFLASYDGLSRTLTYSNGGHLPPVILRQDGSLLRLEDGGTVHWPRVFGGAGGLPAGFADDVAPLLVFLDRHGIRYDLTSDLDLALSDAPRASDRKAVLLAGSERWVTRALARRLRRYVQDGGHLATFGPE